MKPELNAQVEALRQRLALRPSPDRHLTLELLGMIEVVLAKREEEEAELLQLLDSLSALLGA